MSWSGVWEWMARPAHYTAVKNLRMAAERGDAAQLTSLLDPGVNVVVDNGEPERPTIRVLNGIQDAVALLVHGMANKPGLVITERSVNNQAGLAMTRDDETLSVMALDFTGNLISTIWIRLHPDRLRHWNRV